MRTIVGGAILLYSMVIVVRALLSWMPLRSGTAGYAVYKVVYDLTEPYLQIFRRIIPPIRAGMAAIDISPLVGVLVLYVVLRLVL